MTTTAAGAPINLAANATNGVGVTSGKNMTLMPAAARTPAASSAKPRLEGRASKPRTTGADGGPPSLVSRWSASPRLVRITTARFMRFDPGPTSPRIPAVPKVSEPPMARNSASSSPESTRLCSCPRVTGSGSPAIQSFARSRRSGTPAGYRGLNARTSAIARSPGTSLPGPGSPSNRGPRRLWRHRRSSPPHHLSAAPPLRTGSAARTLLRKWR